MGTGIGLEGDSKTAGAERSDIAAGGADRNAGIPFAVDDQDTKFAAGLEPTQGGEAARDPAVDGNNAGKPLGVTKAQTVGHRRTLADPDQVNSLGVDVKRPAGLTDRREDAVFEQVDRVGKRLQEPPPDELAFGERRRRVAVRAGRDAQKRDPSRNRRDCPVCSLPPDRAN